MSILCACVLRLLVCAWVSSCWGERIPEGFLTWNLGGGGGLLFTFHCINLQYLHVVYKSSFTLQSMGVSSWFSCSDFPGFFFFCILVWNCPRDPVYFFPGEEGCLASRSSAWEGKFNEKTLVKKYSGWNFLQSLFFHAQYHYNSWKNLTGAQKVITACTCSPERYY